ncbi:MAG: C40 family peptidase [Candidatus Dormibacteria bacterium]
MATTAGAPPTLVAKVSPTRSVLVAPVLLPLPPLTTAAAALYLTPLPPATQAPAQAVTGRVETAAVTDHVMEQHPVTVKAAGTTGGLAARVVSAAAGRQGDPYVYGGASPGAFDCSGLVQWAYQRIGISLPRTAAAQSSQGRPVSVKDLQPGDLLFFYAPVDHVTMYAGDGKIVEASQPGTPVHVRPMYLQGFVGARRLIG